MVELQELLENFENGDVQENGGVGPLRYITVGGQRLTVFDGPFRTRIRSSGPVRRIFESSGTNISESNNSDNNEGDSNGQTRGSNTERNVLV